jgi:Neuraminidase (sialidase)
MQQADLCNRYLNAARQTLTNVSNLASFRKQNGLVLQYTTQAGDNVQVQLEQGFMQTKAAITYTIHDGPRSRTEQRDTTTACLVTLLKDLNAEAAV